jgi:hypothetical protein
MKLLNRELGLLVAIVKNEELDIKKSSARRRFLRVLSPFVEDYNAEVNDINIKYSLKKDDKPVIVNEVYQFDAKGKKDRRKVIDALSEQEVEINMESNKADITVMKSVINDVIKKMTKDKMVEGDYEILATLEEIVAKMK